jgi:hypothetical protein
MDLIIPSERTVTLLAGVFKITPHELVDGTTYPLAKAEKLPLTTCSYTAFELELALLETSWLVGGLGNWLGEYAVRVRALARTLSAGQAGPGSGGGELPKKRW